MRLVCPEVDALRAEGRRAGRTWRVREDVVALFAKLHVFETGVADDLCKRCLRQRAGNSTGPEIDIVARVFRHISLNDNVGDL